LVRHEGQFAVAERDAFACELLFLFLLGLAFFILADIQHALGFFQRTFDPQQ